MAVDADVVSALIREELAGVSDPVLRQHIAGTLIPPRLIDCAWDYHTWGNGEPTYPCWIVASEANRGEVDAKRGVAIVYSEHGFGPRLPWGLIWMPQPEDTQPPSMGPDSSWFFTFLEAFEDGFVWPPPNC